MQTDVETLQFGRFSLEPERRALLVGGTPAALSSRAYDILEFLVRNRDRIVSRDEIVAHVWRGVTVGENNLSVQMSALRRVLAEQSNDELSIVNFPGRGYRFVATVKSSLQPNVGTTDPDLETVISAAPLVLNPSPKRGIGRWMIAGAAACAFIGAILLTTAWPEARSAVWAAWSSLRAPAPDSRLTLSIAPFTAVGDDPRTVALAARYTEASLARFGQFEDLVLLPQPGPEQGGFHAHFRLTGTLQIIGSNAVVTIRVTEGGTGRLLSQTSHTAPITASISDQYGTAMELLAGIRPALFRAEFDSRKGPPRDALDYLIEAHVFAGQLDQPSSLQRALSLAERAVQLDPASRPARVLLSVLLTYHMLSSDARRGDSEGVRALNLIDGVLLEEPRNFLNIEHRAFSLVALGRLDEAQATTELGLQIEPGFYASTQKLGEILMQKGDLAKAKELLELDPEDIRDDRLATLAFATADYPRAIDLSRRIIAAAPGDWNSQFTLLLQAAALILSGDHAAAKAALAQSMASLPQELKSVAAQRQSFYGLPDDAWKRFKFGLMQAGMPP